MIRHALAPAACPVGPVPVAVIVPSLRAFLVFPLGGALLHGSSRRMSYHCVFQHRG